MPFSSSSPFGPLGPFGPFSPFSPFSPLDQLAPFVLAPNHAASPEAAETPML
jgi:hypothetical protein